MNDDADTLMESIITGKYKAKAKEVQKGPIDTLVQEAYDKAMEENKGAI